MKPQDIGFLLLLIVLLFKRDERLFVIAGLACLFLAIPFFSLWIFFTAERLTYYAAAFFLLSLVLSIHKQRKT